MPNLITVVILALLFGCVTFYIVKSKKKGAKCIGCPYSKSCSDSKSGICKSHNN